VHREHLVVRLLVHQRVFRLNELRTDDQRLETAQHKEEEGRYKVRDADAFVVDCGDPAPEAGFFLDCRPRHHLRRRLGYRCHPLLLP
jgi:hypothetical protein